GRGLPGRAGQPPPGRHDSVEQGDADLVDALGRWPDRGRLRPGREDQRARLTPGCLRLWAAPRPRMGRPQDEDPPPARRDPRPTAPGRCGGHAALGRAISDLSVLDEGPPPRLAVPPIRRGAAPRARLAGPRTPRGVLVIHAVPNQLHLVMRLEPEPLPRTEERLTRRSSEAVRDRVPEPSATGVPEQCVHLLDAPGRAGPLRVLPDRRRQGPLPGHPDPAPVGRPPPGRRGRAADGLYPPLRSPAQGPAGVRVVRRARRSRALPASGRRLARSPMPLWLGAKMW